MSIRSIFGFQSGLLKKEDSDHGSLVMKDPADKLGGLDVVELWSEEDFSICRSYGYELKKDFLGRGSFGTVFLAIVSRRIIKRNPRFRVLFPNARSLKVAIKIVDLDQGRDMLEQLSVTLPNEVEVMNRFFGFPLMIRLFETFIERKKLFLVMELADTSLKQIILDERDAIMRRRIPPPNIKSVFYGAVRAMNHLHMRGIAHRDIKPDNILMMKNGIVKLGDFGFSVDMEKVFDDDNNRIFSNVCGTICFMAPEVAKPTKYGYDPFKADIWSMGLVLFYILSGENLFPTNNVDKLRQMHHAYSNQVFPFHKYIHEDVAKLVKRMLNKDPIRRPSAALVMNDCWFEADGFRKTKKSIHKLEIEELLACKKVKNFKQEEFKISKYIQNKVESLNKLEDVLSTNKFPQLHPDTTYLRTPRITEQVTRGDNRYEIWRLRKQMTPALQLHPDSNHSQPIYKGEKAFEAANKKVDVVSYEKGVLKHVITIRDLPVYGKFLKLIPVEQKLNVDPALLAAKTLVVAHYYNKISRIPFTWNVLFYQNRYNSNIFARGVQTPNMNPHHFQHHSVPCVDRIYDFNLMPDRVDAFKRDVLYHGRCRWLCGNGIRRLDVEYLPRIKEFTKVSEGEDEVFVVINGSVFQHSLEYRKKIKLKTPTSKAISCEKGDVAKSRIKKSTSSCRVDAEGVKEDSNEIEIQNVKKDPKIPEAEKPKRNKKKSEKRRKSVWKKTENFKSFSFPKEKEPDEKDFVTKDNRIILSDKKAYKVSDFLKHRPMKNKQTTYMETIRQKLSYGIRKMSGIKIEAPSDPDEDLSELIKEIKAENKIRADKKKEEELQKELEVDKLDYYDEYIKTFGRSQWSKDRKIEKMKRRIKAHLEIDIDNIYRQRVRETKQLKELDDDDDDVFYLADESSVKGEEQFALWEKIYSKMKMISISSSAYQLASSVINKLKPSVSRLSTASSCERCSKMGFSDSSTEFVVCPGEMVFFPKQDDKSFRERWYEFKPKDKYLKSKTKKRCKHKNRSKATDYKIYKTETKLKCVKI